MLPRLRTELDRDDYRIRTLRGRADGLRVNQTPAETKLKAALGPYYMFQVALLDYIVDFLDPHLGIVIEIDGVYHDEKPVKDRRREWQLNRELGLCTIRFWYGEVLDNLEDCLARIEAFTLMPLLPEPVLPPSDEELERKRQRSLELKMIRDSVHEFEVNSLHKTRAQVLEDFSTYDTVHPEVRTRIEELVRYWPDQGYAGIGLQSVTKQKRNP